MATSNNDHRPDEFAHAVDPTFAARMQRMAERVGQNVQNFRDAVGVPEYKWPQTQSKTQVQAAPMHFPQPNANKPKPGPISDMAKGTPQQTATTDLATTQSPKGPPTLKNPPPPRQPPKATDRTTPVSVIRGLQETRAVPLDQQNFGGFDYYSASPAQVEEYRRKFAHLGHNKIPGLPDPNNPDEILVSPYVKTPEMQADSLIQRLLEAQHRGLDPAVAAGPIVQLMRAQMEGSLGSRKLEEDSSSNRLAHQLGLAEIASQQGIAKMKNDLAAQAPTQGKYSAMAIDLPTGAKNINDEPIFQRGAFVLNQATGQGGIYNQGQDNGAVVRSNAQLLVDKGLASLDAVNAVLQAQGIEPITAGQ